jgi:sulfotransferase
MNKRIYFLAGLPRSGSTLLANILAQNPQFHVTPTSGIVDMLVQVRNAWDHNDAFQAADRTLNQAIKENVLRAMLEAYFSHTPRPICIDKNRFWAECGATRRQSLHRDSRRADPRLERPYAFCRLR